VSDAALVLHQLRYTNRSFWRNPPAAFFVGIFPLMFLVLFTSIFGNDTTRISATQVVSTSTFYVPAIASFAIITAGYTNLAMSTSAARELGTLKRIRGTPFPAWTYLTARILHGVVLGILLVVICTAFGGAFYHIDVPSSSLPAFAVTVVIGSAAFCALGLALSAVIPNVDAAPAIVNATILPLTFISNIFIPGRNMPDWLQTLSRVFPVRHFADAMLGSYLPAAGSSGWRGDDLLILAAWGIAGAAFAARYFTWEPRR
jgi:ABC-2 type transport system permease protein